MKPRFRILLPILFLTIFCSVSYGQTFAVKANALSLALGTPDLGVELVTGEHSSVALSVFGTKRPYGLECSLLAVQPEFRFWFNGRPLTREYIGCIATAVRYDIATGVQAYRGDAISLGITGGYVWNLGKRWAIEASGGFGFMLFHQKQHFRDDNYDDSFSGETSRINNYGYKLFPSKLAVTFIYIIK